MDDGTVARLDDETFYVTTTSTGADGVYQWFTWWNAVWHMDVAVREPHRARRRGQRRRAERARGDGARLRTTTSPTEGFAYLDAKHVRVAGVPTLALRIGFVGELGYELHFPSPHGEHVWDALLEQGGRPRRAPVRPRAAADPAAREGPRDRQPGHRLRVEPARGGDAVDRQERQGVRLGRQVGDRSRSPSAASAGCSSGSRARPARCRSRAARSSSTAGRRAASRASRRSAELGKVIGLAIVPNELAVEGGRLRRAGRRPAGADARAPRPLLRPRGREAEVVSALRFLSVDAAADGGARSRARRSTARSATPAPRSRSATAGSSPSRSPARRSTRRSGSPTSRIYEVRGPARQTRACRLQPDDGSLVPHLAAPRARALLALAGRRRPRADRRTLLARRDGRLLGPRARRPEAQTVLRRLTHLHHFPSGGEIAHVRAMSLDRAAGGYRILCRAGARPLRLGGRARPRARARRRAVGVDALRHGGAA